MELQGMKRRRRDTIIPLAGQNETSRNATVATYTLLRGFLNAVATDDDQCQMLFMCETGSESAPYGPLASKMSNLARYLCNFFICFLIN